MTARHTVDTVTEHDLDQLHEELRQARLAADRCFHNGLKGVGAAEIRALNAEERAKQAEAAIGRVRALHPEGSDGRCEACYVPWPCPDICCLNGPPGCRNCGEYHTPIGDWPKEAPNA
ncbi:hypothetical protein OG749_36160 [Streptomyces nojiriensis]|uniref:hypothetical protein n=1 Tax=Streptomyces nojiriensis TaxID=66374 RepID=UPI002E1876C9